jgi:flavin reductase (DIM6/NTAB) family NADH-FMN oxidoreductase RutF
MRVLSPEKGSMSRTPTLSGGFPDRIARGAIDGTEPVNGFPANWFAWAGYYPDVVAVI